MSKERALRRAERERQTAATAAVRLAERERRQRRDARRRSLGQALTRWLPRGAGAPSGIIAERRRGRHRMLTAALVLVQVLVWISWRDWAASLAALVVSLLLLPLLIAFAHTP